MKCRIIPIDLKLRREFVLPGGKASIKRNLVIEIEDSGLGEAAGSVHYGASDDQVQADLEYLLTEMRESNGRDIPVLLKQIGQNCCPQALCAVSSAWHDWRSKTSKIPLYQFLGLKSPGLISTSVTASLGDMEGFRDMIETGYDKIKVKLDADIKKARTLAMLLKESEHVRVRLDANGSWSYDEAIKILEILPGPCIEFIEQPFPTETFDDWQKLRETVSLPLFTDEGINNADDVKKVAFFVDGVNIKIQKSGCLEMAINAMKTARELGLKVMLGCMIESSVGIATAYHLAALADYHDLDGRWLVEDDTFQGLEYSESELIVNGKYGHGVSLA